jgi:hypothetical protein
MRLGGDELIGDKKLFLFAVGLLREYEMAQVVEDCAFAAGGAGEVVLGLYFAEWRARYEEESREARDCAHR